MVKVTVALTDPSDSTFDVFWFLDGCERLKHALQVFLLNPNSLSETETRHALSSCLAVSQ